MADALLFADRGTSSAKPPHCRENLAGEPRHRPGGPDYENLATAVKTSPPPGWSGLCDARLARKNWKLEWADVIRDLDNLMEMEVAIGGKAYVFRGQTPGVAGKVFQACGVALPPTLRSC